MRSTEESDHHLVPGLGGAGTLSKVRRLVRLGRPDAWFIVSGLRRVCCACRCPLHCFLIVTVCAGLWNRWLYHARFEQGLLLFSATEWLTAAHVSLPSAARAHTFSRHQVWYQLLYGQLINAVYEGDREAATGAVGLLLVATMLAAWCDWNPILHPACCWSSSCSAHSSCSPHCEIRCDRFAAICLSIGGARLSVRLQVANGSQPDRVPLYAMESLLQLAYSCAFVATAPSL